MAPIAAGRAASLQLPCIADAVLHFSGLVTLFDKLSVVSTGLLVLYFQWRLLIIPPLLSLTYLVLPQCVDMPVNYIADAALGACR